jgi:hypothetical protein
VTLDPIGIGIALLVSETQALRRGRIRIERLLDASLDRIRAILTPDPPPSV